MIVPKNINDALLPITIISWIMGTGIIEYPLGNPQTIFSIIYSIICIIILTASIVFNYFSISTIYSEEIQMINKLILTVFIIGCYFLCLIVIILSKINAQKLKFCLQELNSVDEKMKRIGIMENYSKSFRMSIITAAIFIVYLIIFFVILFAKHVNKFNAKSICTILVTFYFVLGAPYIIECKFIHIISYIKIKFCKLNEALDQLSECDFYSPQKTKLYITQVGLIRAAKKELNNEGKLIGNLQMIHLDLVRISRSVNDIFRIEIVISVGLSVVFLIFLYISSLYDIFNKETKMLWLKLIISINYLNKILAINNICHTTSAEALMTGKILFELETRDDEDCFNKIKQFLFAVRHNHLLFTANGFFHLNHNCIQYIAGIITPYIITTRYKNS